MTKKQTFEVRLSFANDSFQYSPPDEVANILGALASKLRDTTDIRLVDGRRLMDSNGNTVGRVTVR